jgi:pyruvate kinase
MADLARDIPDKAGSLPLLTQLYRLRDDAIAEEAAQSDYLSEISDRYLPSARNLVHYVSVRRQDIRDLQRELMERGLSSLGLLEPHTLASLNRVIDAVERMETLPSSEPAHEPVNMQTGRRMLSTNTDDLLGSESPERGVRVMVTMPTEAASDPTLVEDLLKAGMNVMRINCAHDGPTVWQAMVDKLRAAEAKTGLRCRIQADLGGPKVRTGAIESAGQVRKYRPTRSALGEVVRPGRILFTAQDRMVAPGERLAVLPLDQATLAKLKVGDALKIRDARGRKRRIDIVAKHAEGMLGEHEKSIYITTGTQITLARRGEEIDELEAGVLPDVAEAIRLFVGDELLLTRSDEPGEAVARDEDGNPTAPGSIHCTLAEAFEQVETGDPVWFDDGKIGGIVKNNDGEEILIEITHSRPGGRKLKAEKGINFPATKLAVDALTDKDIEDLEQVVPYADMVALSFLRRPEDVIELEDHMTRLDAQHIGVVIKVENRQAFENLPAILLVALRSPPVGVMLARGDLAVEVGFDRLSEAQEEILWMCEAAHVPVIWATQILETMAKTGAPTRAEVTDAAASHRAECAMLNKGPHIVETTEFLCNVLSRMDSHAYKRRSMLRRLEIADSL